MKRLALLSLLTLVFVSIGGAAYQEKPVAEPSLSKFVPSGPLLYLEAKDFSSLLSDWNSSPEKATWVAGSNYEIFSRSRLFLRLKNAGDQFAAAAGLPPDMDFLSQVAGTHSALALYDIGNLQFLYITYLPSAHSMQTKLWQARATFEPRSAGGVNFYVRRDPESKKEVAFAVAGDYLLLATREDLLASTLQLMAGSKDQTVKSEPWWTQTVSSAGPAGDLRMVLNLEKIVSSSYFRTYWVQQNITDMKQYSAAISDLFRTPQSYREERVLIRKNSGTPDNVAGFQSAADLVRLVPDDRGFYEARALPSTADSINLLQTKLLAPHSGPMPASQIAPRVQLGSGETGTSSDLETRIDQAPAQRRYSEQNVSPLQQLFSKSQILASLNVQSTDQDSTGVFVRIHTAIALASSSEWNDADVRTALVNTIAPNLTASQLGIAWEQKSGYQLLDGLWSLAVAVHGKYLLVADDPALIEKMLANLNRASRERPAAFIAQFNHVQEQGTFARFSASADQNQTDVSGAAHEPQFFSESLVSLSKTFRNISSEKVLVYSDGDKVRQTVTYERKE